MSTNKLEELLRLENYKLRDALRRAEGKELESLADLDDARARVRDLESEAWSAAAHIAHAREKAELSADFAREDARERQALESERDSAAEDAIASLEAELCPEDVGLREWVATMKARAEKAQARVQALDAERDTHARRAAEAMREACAVAADGWDRGIDRPGKARSLPERIRAMDVGAVLAVMNKGES